MPNSAGQNGKLQCLFTQLDIYVAYSDEGGPSVGFIISEILVEEESVPTQRSLKLDMEIK